MGLHCVRITNNFTCVLLVRLSFSGEPSCELDNNPADNWRQTDDPFEWCRPLEHFIVPLCVCVVDVGFDPSSPLFS